MVEVLSTAAFFFCLLPFWLDFMLSVLEQSLSVNLLCFQMLSALSHYVAVYEAGKAAKKGVLSQYPPTMYSAMYAQPVYGGSQGNQSIMPLLPIHNGVGQPQSNYGHDYDGASSGNITTNSVT